MSVDGTRAGPDRITGGEQHTLARTLVVPAHDRARAGGSGQPNGLFVGPADDSDRFELVGVGLSGGEGVTWCGRYAGRLNHPVTYAIKQLQPPANDAPAVWPTSSDVRRWLDQRFLLQTVTNDHLVRLVDVFLGPPPHHRGDVVGSPEGVEFATPYLVMEWVEGLTVAERVARRLDPVGDRMGWVLDIAEALEALHSDSRTSGNPMLHRDVKPENCIVHPQRGAVLVDVGALRGVDDGADPRGLHTERYAAPEVLADTTAPRATTSDLYSLGALAYFCLVEDDPPTASQLGRTEQMRAALTIAAERHQVADVAGVTEAVLVMLSPDPAARPSLPRSWARSVVSATTGPRSGHRRRPPAGPGESRTVGGPPARRRAGRYAAALVALTAAGTVAATWGIVAAAGPSASAVPEPGRAGPASPPTVEPSTSTTGPTDRVAVTVRNPTPGSLVRRCEVFTGTASLPAEKSIVLTMRNLSDREKVFWLEPVQGWEAASGATWRGWQFFGSGSPDVEVVGKYFEVRVLVMDRAAIVAGEAAATTSDLGWSEPHLPDGAQQVATMTFLRAAGPGPAECT